MRWNSANFKPLRPIATRPQLDTRTFSRFCELIYAQAGIRLGAQKEALVAARLGKRMQRLGIGDFAEYYRCIEADGTGTELTELLDALTTNVTQFYRERAHFEFLAEALRGWAANGQRRYRLWSAAAATGEEPYTMAMTLRETLGETLSDARILATDLSTHALATGRGGRYGTQQVDGLPAAMLAKYFTRTRGAAGEISYAVNDPLKKLVTFARLNLSQPPFPMRGPFDVIFCCNVMIYFDDAVRQRLLVETQRLLRPGGYLMVGHTESLIRLARGFTSVRPSVYRKD